VTAALVTDSTSYLPPALAAELGITVVPLHVVLDGESFDEPDLPPAEFYRRLRASGQPPTTSQPSPGEFLQAFTATGADRVLCVTCTASLSGTHASATLAAGMAPMPVEVVDSGTISGGLCLLVAEVGRALAAGTPYDDAVALARSLATRVASSWTSDTTALLQAGGRFADDVPDGVPVLALEGTVRALGSARSAEEAVDLQAQAIRAAAAASPTRVTVGHGDVPELADALAGALDGAPGILGVDRYVVGPVVGAHAGAGNVGASWFR
jgi:DegV family protein with EDD domain